MIVHKCKQLEEAKSGLWGCAVSDITYDEEHKCWEMNNMEYSSFPIVCCPFCGLRLDGKEMTYDQELEAEALLTKISKREEKNEIL